MQVGTHSFPPRGNPRKDAYMSHANTCPMPPGGYTPRKVVSLNLELSTLEHATRGAQILSDLQATGGFPDDDSERAAPLCITAMLTLLGVRLRHLRRVVRGEENPAHLWEPHNSAGDAETLADGEDVFLPAWDTRSLTGISPGAPAGREAVRPRRKPTRGKRQAPKRRQSAKPSSIKSTRAAPAKSRPAAAKVGRQEQGSPAAPTSAAP